MKRIPEHNTVLKMIKKIPRKFFICVICILLSSAMFILPPLNAFAAGQQVETKYVKDVIFIYGENQKEAASRVPKGYTMLDTDLNQGAAYVFAVDDVYLAYSTTTDPEEAITDIKMMNMNGGFSFSDYNEQLKNVGQNIKDMANELKIAVQTFVENYKANKPGAKAAYAALKVFTVDEADGQNLADYFIYSDVPDSFYLKVILNVHTNILSTILSALTMAVQGDVGNTWLDRLAKIDDPYSIYNDDYWDKATALWEHFDSFYKTYSSIDHDLYNTGDGEIQQPSDNEGNIGDDVSENASEADVGNTGIEVLYELAYRTLDNYTFGDGTPISEWLVNDYIYEEMLYPLIEVMTPAEYAMMHLCGPLYMILSTGMSEQVYNEYVVKVEEITLQMGSCSIWHGVNTELFHSSIGITDEANRALAETKAEQEFNNDGDSGLDDTIKMAGLIASVGAITLGVGLVATSFTAGSLASMLTGATASTMAVCTAIGGALFIAAGVIILCVALVVAVVYLIVWLKAWYDEHHPEYTEIPQYMYDLVVDEYENRQFIIYEVAKSHDGKAVDVNAWEGKEWHAPYISRDKAAGNPIEADFMIKLGDGEVEDGYAPLSAFGHNDCENLNKYADSDDVNGIFISFKQQKLEGAFARGKYLSDIKLFTDENAERCLLKLSNENYKLYNVNITPNSGKYTYIGYKTTNKANLALTDIRISYRYASTQYSAGGMNETYAASGSCGDLTLYSTRISMFGSPILSEIIHLNNHNAPAGYEPVNFFSGGPAVNLNNKGDGCVNQSNTFYLYFLPSKTYTSGTEYLGGFATGFNFIKQGFTMPGGPVKDVVENIGYKTLKLVTGTSNTQGTILYTTTYNPYRAIYSITALSTGEDTAYAYTETFRCNGIGYSLALRYIVDVENDLRYEYLNRENDSRLYVSGIYKDGTPLQVSDIIVSDTQNFSKDGYTPVDSELVHTGRAVNISNAFNYSYHATYSHIRDFEMAPMYLFVRAEPKPQNKYITNIYLSSKDALLDGVDLDCSDLDNVYLLSSLASQGAHTVIPYNLNLYDPSNRTYFGYAKTYGSRTPITDVILYYAGDTKNQAEKKIIKNGITYHLVNELNIFSEEDGENDKCRRVYMYYTTNPAAGTPIYDIKIDQNAILNGWETVRTQNDKALHEDMDKYSKSMWYLHLKRNATEPKYISEIVIGWGSDTEAKAMLVAAGCEYMLTKDLNDNCGLASDYIYLGFKRTSDINQAIRDLQTVHDEDMESFKKNGVTYTKIKGNLNSYTSIFADDIFLYYTKDEKAGAPIINLKTSENPRSSAYNNITESTVKNQHNDDSDLNDGAAGDYIYLIQVKEVNNNSQPASILGNGSAMIILLFSAISLSLAISIFIIQKKRYSSQSAESQSQSTEGDQ